MNSQTRNALMTLGFTVLMSGAMLYGQTQRSEIADIPFTFQAGAKVMPAGTYSATITGSGSVIQLQERATGKSVMVGAFVAKAGRGNQSKLGFRCYGSRCFLSEVWYADQAAGHGIVKSAREKEIAANAEAPKVVYFASR